jgi:Na+/proline symporter
MNDAPTGITVSADPWTILTFIVYLLFMVGIGIYSARFSSAGIGEFFIGGKAFSSSFGFPHRTGVFLTAIIVLGYTLIGGFLAVSLTDVVQAVFMLVALLIVPVIAVADYGGLQPILQQAATIDAFTVDPMALGFGGLIGYLGIGLGSHGEEKFLQSG